MKFLRKATAAGLAGCMLLTAALPETAAFAVYGDFTSVTQMATSTPEFTAGDLTFSLFENYAEVKKCAKEATEVVIPAEVEGLPVTSIGSLAFSDCPSLTSVTIPDSVTSIGESAFHKCTSLADITIPDSATSIGGRAFAETPWLAAQQKKGQFVIVNGVLIDGTTCTGDVTIPDSVKSIGEFAFYSCKAITSVTIPDGVTSIGKYAFTACLALTSVNIPDSVVSIGENAFCRCEALPSLTIPASVTSIDKQTFSACKAFTDFTVPANVTSIAQSAFYGSTSLTSVTILNPDCAIHDEETTFPETAVIKGYSNSSAQAYAKKYNRTFESLGDAPAEPVPAATEPVTDPAESEGVTAPKVDPEIAFKEVLDMFRKNVSEGWANFDGKTAEGVLNSEDLTTVSPLWLTQLKDKKLDEVGYDYHDGVLSIGVGGVYGCVDGYAIKDGKIIHLCSAGEKTEYKISDPYIETIVLDEATDASQETSYDLVDGALVPESARKQDKDGKYYRADEITLQKDGSYVYNWQEVDSSKYNTWRAYRAFQLTMLSEGMSVPATEPGTYETADLEFSTDTPFTKKIDGVSYAVKISGAFAVSGPSELNSADTADAAVIDELNGYVLEAVQYAAMNTDFTAENYNSFLLDIGSSATAYFKENGYNKKTDYTLAQIAVSYMTVKPEETPVPGNLNVTVPANLQVELNKTKTFNLEVVSIGKTIKQVSSGAAGSPQYSLKWDVVKVADAERCTVPVSIMAKGTAGSYDAKLSLLVTFTDGSTATIPVTLSFTIGETSTDPTEPKTYKTEGLKFGTATPFVKEIDGVSHTVKISGVYGVSGPSELDSASTADAAVIDELKGYVLEAVQYAVMNTDFTAENYNSFLLDIGSTANAYYKEKGYDKKTAYTLTQIAINNMVVKADETATDPTEPEYPYSFAIPANKTVKPGDEVDVGFLIVNAGALPLAEIDCDWFTNMGLCPENATVKITPETENDTDKHQSLINIHFTVGKNALAGVYPIGITVTNLRDSEGNIVVSKMNNSTERMTIIVKPEDAAEEPTAPAQTYNVLFPKAAVKQGESKEIKLSIQHNTTAKYLKSIKAGSYTADGLTFTWEAMDLDDKENSTLYIPMTVTAAADAEVDTHKYYIPLENVLVNEDGETVPLSSLVFSRHGSLIVDKGEAAKPLYTITAPEIPAMTAGQEYTFDMTVTRTDGKAIGTINAFRKMGEDDAYYASWEAVTSDKSTATVKVTLKAEKAFSGEVDLGIGMQLEGVDSKDINEEKFKLTITEAPDDQLFNIGYPEIPALTVGQEYTFDVEVTRKDGKAIGTINAFRKMGEDDAYYASWEAVTSDKSTATVKVTLKAEKAFSGEVDLGIGLQIEGTDIKNINEEKFKLTITEAAAFDPSKIEGLGDVNNDGTINASDAALVLIAAAKVGAGNESGLTAEQTTRADVNGDGIVNASDAAIILQYSAMIGAGGEGTLAEYLKAKDKK